MAEDLEKKNSTFFGSDTEFDGVLEFSDKLVITGKFNGKIQATGDLKIEKNSVCTVDSITVKSADILGTVTGDITASERVEMCSGSVVIGDIKTARLRIANNVEFEGQITMLDKEPEEDLFSTASSEFKQALILRSDMIE
jgi:cytoskeletal protein CcmA (bactofilin family)